MIPREPSADECSARTPLGGGWHAIWYPQMGGYAGKAAVYVGDEDGCFDCYVWHDGMFPFSGSDRDCEGKSRQPARLHHCDPDQFIHFGQHVIALQTEDETR